MKPSSPRFRTAVVAAAAALAAALALAPLLRGPWEGWGSRPARLGESENGHSIDAGGGSPPRPAEREALPPHAAFAPAPRPDPMLPVGVELCLPSEHYQPANPPVPAGVDPALVTEGLRARLRAVEAVERDLSVRWRGHADQPFEAVFDFYRRGEGATFHHSCTLLQGADGRWRIIDYTVQRVSPREDEPVLVLTERSREWREVLRSLAVRSRG